MSNPENVSLFPKKIVQGYTCMLCTLLSDLSRRAKLVFSRAHKSVHIYICIINNLWGIQILIIIDLYYKYYSK